MPEFACEVAQPAASQHAPAGAHRFLAVDAGPIRQRRAGDDDGAEEFRANGGEHHDRPSGLAIADHAGLSVGLGVERGDLLEKNRLRARDILNGLAGHGIREEADEIAGMPCLERHADFAVGLEPANPGAMPGARVDDDERPARGVEFDSRGRNHSHETVVDRPIKRFATEDQLHVVVEYVWNRLGEVFAILIAALAHDIPEQHAALRGIDHIFHGWPKYAEWCRKCDRRLTRLARWHWLCSLLTAQPAREGQHACRSFVRAAAAHPITSDGLRSKAHA